MVDILDGDDDDQEKVAKRDALKLAAKKVPALRKKQKNEEGRIHGLIVERDDEAKRIYLILGGEFSPGFGECFNKKFKRTSNFEHVKLGTDYNHFNKRYMDIRILGPYKVTD